VLKGVRALKAVAAALNETIAAEMKDGDLNTAYLGLVFNPRGSGLSAQSVLETVEENLALPKGVKVLFEETPEEMIETVKAMNKARKMETSVRVMTLNPARWPKDVWLVNLMKIINGFEPKFNLTDELWEMQSIETLFKEQQ
jgi:hypothetical protein